MKQRDDWQRRRWRLALLRLLLLFVLSCLLTVATSLCIQAAQNSGRALVEPRPTLAPADAHTPFLGINTALEQYATPVRRTALQRLRRHGFGWVRQRLDWGMLEPAPGDYDWRTSDALLQEITDAGLIPVIVLDGSPAWARAPEDSPPTANAFAPPASPTTFARFATAFAARYHNSLRYYQIWDEPNIAPHWGNRMIEPVAYAQLLKAVVPALRTADSDAVIILAALAPTSDRGHLAIDEVYYLQRLYATGAAPFFDIVAAQPFGFGYAPDDKRARPEILNFQRIKLLRRAMIAAGDGHKPIWAVRYGWNIDANSPWRTVRTADQLAFATTALTIARQEWPWLTAMAWAVDQPAAPPTDPSWGFALTPPLADAFYTWQTTQSYGTTPPITNAFDHRRWVGLLVLWLLVGWRTTAAIRILPWSQWRCAYVGWSQWGKGISWLALLMFYYFVTWPPLIVIGWLLLVLLMLPNRLVGLGLVALVLPFYFQHKEVALLNNLIKIPPAHAALLCLWLALSSHACPALTAMFKQPTLTWVKRFHLVDWLVLAWVVINLGTAVNVWHWPAYRQGIVDLLLLPVLAYLATRLLATTAVRQQCISSALFGGGLLAALLGLVMWGTGQGTPADGVLRLVGPYFSPNHTALYLERTWWLGLGLALSWHGRRRYGFWLALGLVGLALWLTASRGAWVLGMPAGAVVFGWTTGLFQHNRRRWLAQWARRTGLVGLGVAILLGIGVTTSSSLWLRLTNSATVAERLAIWQAAFHLWQDHWLLGVGPGGFFWRYPGYLSWSAHVDPNLLHPHNLWLELLAGWGALGLLWFSVVLWQVWRLGYTLRSKGALPTTWQAGGLLAALAAGVAHGQVDTFGALPDLAVWNWLALGLLVTAVTHKEQQIGDRNGLIPSAL